MSRRDQQHHPAYARGRRDVGGLVKAMHDAAPRTLLVLRVMSYEDRTPIIDRFVAEGGGARAALPHHLADLALRDTTASGRLVGPVAVALVEQEGRRQGWTGPWARIIADLGGSPHKDVRVAAWRAAIL